MEISEKFDRLCPDSPGSPPATGSGTRVGHKSAKARVEPQCVGLIDRIAVFCVVPEFGTVTCVGQGGPLEAEEGDGGLLRKLLKTLLEGFEKTRVRVLILDEPASQIGGVQPGMEDLQRAAGLREGPAEVPVGEQC